MAPFKDMTPSAATQWLSITCITAMLLLALIGASTLVERLAAWCGWWV